MTKITIVNGGSQGLGEAVARRLVEQGSGGLVLTGRSLDRGQALAAELSAAGTPTLFAHVDMAEPGAPQRVVDMCAERFGTVNGLVNVAAATTRRTLWQDTPEHFDAMMHLNVSVPYFLIQAASKLMVSTGAKGSIVNVGSTCGHGGPSKLSAYSISKGALATMTRNLSFALMRHNVRVNQVNPGWMDTESEHRTQTVEDKAPENWLELAEAGRPMGRLVKPWEVANLIVFCLSDESGLFTGNLMDVDQSVLGAGDLGIPSIADTPQL